MGDRIEQGTETAQPESAARRRLLTYAMLGHSLPAPEPEYAECTCGHYYSDHDGGVCGFAGCGCTHG